MTKKPFWHGYKDAQDYFTNAPDDLLQKHYSRIKDFDGIDDIYKGFDAISRLLPFIRVKWCNL
jgi:hypothetical protein